jgi:DNA-binding CsgD family transcriptional regulator
MQIWQVRPQGGTAVAVSAVAGLLDACAQGQPATGIYTFVDAVVAVDYLSLVEYVAQAREGLAAPELVAGVSAPDIPNVTSACFATYRQRYWRHDEATRIAQHLGGAALPLVAMRLRPEDIGVPAWRREIYDGVALEERLSLLYTPLDGRAFGINLYRSRRRGPYGDAEVERLLGLAPLLARVHRSALAGPARALDADARVVQAAAALARRLPELSARERAVCARIACGCSADGIAADLDVAPSTVATLRKRAYAKLTRRGLGSGRNLLARLAA